MSKKGIVFAPGMTSKGSLNKDGDTLNIIAAKNLYNFQYIDKSKIHSNVKNKDFDQVDIEALKDSIERIGLLHNLVVICEEENESYRLISGERRWRAISMMDDTQYKKAFPAGIPCRVQSDKISEIDEEIEIYSANIEQRPTSIEKNLEYVRRLEELYEMKKKSGEIKSVPKAIAEKVGITERQVRKYINIGNLIPELEEAFKNKSLSLEDANKFASLGEHEQMLLAGILDDEGKVTQEDYETVKKINDEIKAKVTTTEEELAKAEEQLSTKDAQIEKLKEMLKASEEMNQKTDSIKTVIEKTEKQKNAIAEKRDTLSKKRQNIVGMSKKELMIERKKTRLERMLDSLDNEVATFEKLWDLIEADPELYAKFQINLEKMKELSGDMS